jgi:hypothetical protein
MKKTLNITIEIESTSSSEIPKKEAEKIFGLITESFREVAVACNGYTSVNEKETKHVLITTTIEEPKV